MNKLETLKRHKTAEGWTTYYQHMSTATNTPMRFGVFTPPQAAASRCPAVYFLAGLTSTEETFLIKASAQRAAARLGLILVTPDTSPRGAGVPGEDESWDFGTGAGFYVNATQSPWSRNYRMYDYVVTELPRVVEAHIPATGRRGIMGHSMGGHGALVIGLRHPDLYDSISAFAPICAPTACPWGEKAFAGYLGEDRSSWLAYDAAHLVVQARDKRRPLLVDQGTGDEFLETQLKTERLKEACASSGYPLMLRMREGYDHGYYFIQTFVDDHLEHHARALS